MTKKTKKDNEYDYKPDDRISIFYVADRIYDLETLGKKVTACQDSNKLLKEITEFKEELLQNIGIDVMIKRQAKMKNSMPIKKIMKGKNYKNIKRFSKRA